MSFWLRRCFAICCLAYGAAAFGSALQQLDFPLSALVRPFDALRADVAGGEAFDEVFFGNVRVLALGPEASLTGATAPETGHRVDSSGSVEILPAAPARGLMLWMADVASMAPGRFRYQGFDAEGALLFDETGRAGFGPTFSRSERYARLVLAPTPIARLVLEPLDGEDWFLAQLALVRSFQDYEQSTFGRASVAEPIGEGALPFSADRYVPDPARGDVDYLLSEDGDLIKSSDGGITWAMLPRPWMELDAFHIHPTRSRHLWVQDRDRLWQSDDGGETWRDSGLSDVNALAFVTGNRTGNRRGFVPLDEVLIAAGGMLYGSADQGASYDVIAPLPARATRLFAQDEQVFSLQGSDGVLYRSPDGGASWVVDPDWFGVRPDRIVFTPCGDLATADGQWFARPNADGLRAPAIPVSPLGTSLERASAYGCEILLPTATEWLWFAGFSVRGYSPPWASPPLPPGLLLYRLLGLDASATPTRKSSRITLPTFGEPEQLRVLDGQMLADLSLRFDAGADNPDIDRYTFQAGRRGFYPVEVRLPPDGREGAWGLTFDAPLAGGGVSVGAVLPAGGIAPGFLAFQLFNPETVSVRIFEYSGGVETLAVRLLRQDTQRREVVAGPFEVRNGDQLTFELDRERYIVEVANGAEDGRAPLAPNDRGYLGGGIYMQPRDILKIGAAYANEGEWNGVRIAMPEWVQEPTNGQIAISPATTGLSEDEFANNYFGGEAGYEWRRDDVEAGGRSYASFEASGNGGQILFVVPELELSVLFTGGNYRHGGVWSRWRDEIVGGHIIPALIHSQSTDREAS